MKIDKIIDAISSIIIISYLINYFLSLALALESELNVIYLWGKYKA